MNKKGFTLVELLAVIAILAILVIVAMPNVLGMFNQAKANTFVTEVQKYMDNAKNEFIAQAMTNGGKGIVFSSNDYSTAAGAAKTKPTVDSTNFDGGELSMDGSPKDYVIWLDRNGNFKRVVIYDANFCYDSFNANAATNASDATKIVPGNATPENFDKSSVDVKDVVEVSDADTIYGTSLAAITGCEGDIRARTE